MSSSASQAATTRSVSEIPKWYMKADYVEACNCDHGCPCNFNGFPTYGFCRALVLYAIKSGSYYGNVKLDGLDVILAASWPKAIHEGNGTAQLYISKGATQEQKDAILQIFSGQAKGEGPFAIFAPTFKYLLEPQFVDIGKNINGKKSTFSVPGVLDVQVESFKNPVTGEEQDTQIHLPKGFIWKLGHAAKSKLMKISTPNLNFDDSGQNVIVSEVEYKGP
jgi:hypothetical protein